MEGKKWEGGPEVKRALTYLDYVFVIVKKISGLKREYT